MITPEELQELAKKKFDFTELMPEYMELFEKKAKQAIAEGNVKMALPIANENFWEKFASLDDMKDAIAKELIKQGFTLRKISVKRNGIQTVPSWHVFFTDVNE